MTHGELKNMVKCGMEYDFIFQNHQYWISHSKEGYHLTKSYVDSQTFETSDELFQNGRVDGKSILELWDDIKQYF